MKTIVNLQPKLLLLVLLSVGCSLVAQTRYKENFKASKDMTVQVNTSYTNVIFETWDKDLVEVEAFVDGENLTEKEKKEIFNDWKFDVLGNSQKVVITSNPNNFEEGIGAIVGLDALKSLESLKALERLGDMPSLGEMPKFDFAFNFDVPEVPDFREIPDWPFPNPSPASNARMDTPTIISMMMVPICSIRRRMRRTKPVMWPNSTKNTVLTLPLSKWTAG